MRAELADVKRRLDPEEEPALACMACAGRGFIETHYAGDPDEVTERPCFTCQGTGVFPSHADEIKALTR